MPTELIERRTQVNDTQAVNYEQEIGELLKSMADVHVVLDKLGLEPSLRHLVLPRASQINRCGFCVEMHTREAREDGETDERLDRVIVWDQVKDFSDREKAALAWTKALTELDNNTDRGALRAELRNQTRSSGAPRQNPVRRNTAAAHPGADASPSRGRHAVRDRRHRRSRLADRGTTAIFAEYIGA
ncbi:MAG: carboxymuconolactone decarboxylase family protein [Rhodospirillales bacterium]|nr:carboxymuconolactone decarboxylase family protein [Rhodospirillales bacterium]